MGFESPTVQTRANGCNAKTCSNTHLQHGRQQDIASKCDTELSSLSLSKSQPLYSSPIFLSLFFIPPL